MFVNIDMKNLSNWLHADKISLNIKKKQTSNLQTQEQEKYSISLQ